MSDEKMANKIKKPLTFTENEANFDDISLITPFHPKEKTDDKKEEKE